MKIAPSILSADFSNLEKDIKKIEEMADLLHIDVMDGLFVQNITIGPCVIKSIRKITSMPFDVHLMIEEPIRYIKDFANAGSDYITIHYEACQNVREAIEEIHKYDKKCGISIKPRTSVEEIYEYLDLVDLVLIMTVEPGFGGQEFMESQLDKIKKLSEKQTDYQFLISVDGGINDKTAELAKEAGADILVAGNYIFKNEDPVDAIFSLKSKKIS